MKQKKENFQKVQNVFGIHRDSSERKQLKHLLML